MKIRFASVVLALSFAGTLGAQQVMVREERQSIKTYPYGGPNPSPTRPGGQNVQQRIYPYFLFDELTSKGAPQEWNVVRLGNPYIEAFVIPAVGGKLAGAVEKSTKKEFIYMNHVLKFRNIAMRGPWTSGGIEANFGIMGHAPSTAAPVDYLVRKNPDGSVSCFVGAMDLPSRTEWRVEYRIPADKAYVESRTLWYNPQPLHQSYYVWMNMAEKAGIDVELVLPGTSWIGHNYNVPNQPWPIAADGRNLAMYKDHEGVGDGSFFVNGKFMDFSGGYFHGTNFGYGHWALHEDVPGQKFFHWSLSRQGGIWENLLTDTDGQYYEHQTGRLLNQSDTGSFAPYSADSWSELFFPYKEIGPMVKATPYGVLNVRHTPGGLVVRFCALQKIDDTLVITDSGQELFRQHITLKPMQVYEKGFPGAFRAEGVRVDVGNKLSYSGDPKDGVLTRPQTFRNYDTNTLEGLYQSAERDDRERRYDAALEKYTKLLERDPSNVRALTRIAEIYCRRAEYRKGLDYARKALDFAMYDPGANFVYGVLSRRLGDLTDAKETMGWAARSMEFRSSAYAELGGLYVMEGNLDRAEEFLKRSLDYDVNNIRTRQTLATVYRLRKQPEKAREMLTRVLELDPLNHLARFEQFLLEPSNAVLQRFQSAIRNELPHETYLEIASYYRNLRQDGDALRALAAAPAQATICYWQAYLLRERQPAESRQALERANALSPYLVFPFREESVPVFEWAAAQSPASWKPSYYLGLLYWGLRRNDDARRMFDGIGERPDYAPAYVTRAFLEKGADAAKAQTDFEKAYALDKKDWRNAYHLANFYTERGANDRALAVAEPAAKQFPDEDAIKVLAARAYLNAGRFGDCNAVLANATILPFEGQSDVHNLFVQCLVASAMSQMKAGQYEAAVADLEKSRDYPERLGTGAPADPDYRVQDYLLKLCYDELKQPAKSGEMTARIAAYTSRRGAADVRPQVEEWYRGTFRTQPERAALDELMRIVRGSSGRRR